MAQSLNYSIVVCSLCSETLGAVSYTFANCGHVICGECNTGLETATLNPVTEADDDWFGTDPGTRVDYLTKNLCVICRKDGRRQRLYLTEEVDQEKKDLENRVKELEEQLRTQMVVERSLLDVRPDGEPVVEVGVSGESSLYCVRCGKFGHLARQKVCLTPFEGKAVKKQVLGDQVKYNQWMDKRKNYFNQLEDKWNNGDFVPRWYYKMFFANSGCAIQVNLNDNVKKLF